MLKDLANANLLRNQVLAIWNFIWYIIQDPSEFICNMIIVKLLFWTCDLWNSSATWANLKKIMELLSLDVAIFIWCLALQVDILCIVCCLILMSKGIWVSIWHSCLLDCSPLVRSFQLLTFNFCLGLVSSSLPHLFNFKSLPPF